MYIAILGRQPALGMAELERLYGSKFVSWWSEESACIDTTQFDFNRLGGSQKAGRVIMTERSSTWNDLNKKIVQYYRDKWSTSDHKTTLGISVYGLNVSPRDIQYTGITLKKQLRSHNVSLRLIPNAAPAHNTAVSHHNKLGLSPNKVELLIVHGQNGQTIIAESIGAQNITAFAARDQARPKTDAFVGMLPPKLARMMVNLAGGAHRFEQFQSKSEASSLPPEARLTPRSSQQLINMPTLLDPFCGTGVVLQEALLLGYRAYGTDLADKMVDYSKTNLTWLSGKFHNLPAYTVQKGDAMTYQWQQPINTVVGETYLGQPFSAPPRPEKLTEVRGNCNHILSTFLKNLAPQLTTGTPLCLAVPAWRDSQGRFTHLPLTRDLAPLGYQRIQLKNVRNDGLLYYREDQIVARELLLLTRA